MNTTGLQLDPEELRRNLAITLGTHPAVLPEHLGLPAGPEMAAPGPITLPQGKPPDLSIAGPQVKGPRGTLAADQAERSRLLDTGSGISQISKKIQGSGFGENHPVAGKILGGLAQGAATIGDIGLNTLGGGFGRLAAQQIPGTEEHHDVLLHQANRQIGDDESEQEKQAQTAEAQARTAAIPEGAQKQQQMLQADLAEHGLKLDENGRVVAAPPEEYTPGFKADIGYKEAQTTALQNPWGKLPDKEPLQNLDQLNQGMQSRYQVLHPGETLPPQFTLPKDATKGDFERIDKLLTASENAAGSQQQRDEAMRMREAMLALATQRLGDTEKKGAKPTADEQRRADLGENLNENLGALEEIISRRPELFGPLAGRWTELRGKFGSDDADIGALQTIEHQLGMAQISAHGMRSAQGIQSAADSIMNHMHSSPKALLGAIQAARNSVKTFQGDVDRAKGQQPNQSTTSPTEKPNDPLGIR